jgi:hypothetical protein
MVTSTPSGASAATIMNIGMERNLSRIGASTCQERSGHGYNYDFMFEK